MLTFAAALVALLLTSCGADDSSGDGARTSEGDRTTSSMRRRPPRPVESVEPVAEGAVRLLTAGDIASCEKDEDEDTAALVEAEPKATVVLLGDVVYDEADSKTLKKCFLPAWRNIVDRSYAVAGNHDAVDGKLDAFFDVFGERAGERNGGWFSAELGEWTLIGLNTNCGQAGGCEKGSEQYDWFVEQLQAVPAGRCVVAAWHHTPITSGGERNGIDDRVADLWRAASEGGVDVVLASHEHNYERFAPLGPDLKPAAGGVPLFVVGTGGFDLYDLGDRQEGSEVLDNESHGFLQVDLAEGGFSWRFRAVGDGEQEDDGEADCR